MILENREIIGKIDRSNMLKLIEEFDQQCINARSISVPDIPAQNYNCIVCAGMGGSAIAGDILKELTEEGKSIPFVVHRDYGLPNFVNERSLVLTISYSGNTEETISAFKEAIKRKSTIVSLSSGGELEDLSKKYSISHIKIPAGQPPRCSLGYIFFPLAHLLEKSGFIKVVNVEKIAEIARDCRNRYGVENEKNKAKDFARLMHGKNVVIYSGQTLFPVITRWKTQLAENSKQMVSVNLFPEMNHNEIMAWNFPSVFIKNTIVFFLYDRTDNERVKIRMDLTSGILKSKSIPVYEIEGEENEKIERMFSLIFLGDWISFYLALLNGVDPTEIKEISYLKTKLTESL